MTFTAADLAVIIPTHKRWPILRQTLAALAAQSEQGFSTTVVVDGRDFPVPDDLAAGAGVDVVVQDHGGPGAARNNGVRLTTQPLVLFLGDDMVPTPQLIARHLAVHNRCPEDTVAVLGHVEWHPDVPRNRVMRWLETCLARPGVQRGLAVTTEDAGKSNLATDKAAQAVLFGQRAI
jgi:GT2 family glycosyltransferase